MKDIFKEFRKGDRKTEITSVRFDKQDRKFLETMKISATKCFQHGLDDLKKKVKEKPKKK